MVECCNNCNFCRHSKCFRYPPTVSPNNIYDNPPVKHSGWCGEWKRKNDEVLDAKLSKLHGMGLTEAAIEARKIMEE